MDQPVRIIFFDIDGTLVDHATGQISHNTRQTLHRLQKNGILLCVATGRAPCSLPDFGDLHFDMFATFNGALCYSETETILSDPLPAPSVQRVIENAAALGRPVSIATKDRLVANGVEKDLADYYALAGLTLAKDEDFDTACQEDVYQILVGCREADHPALIQGATGVKLAVSWDRAVDVISANGGKGRAVKQILEHFRIASSQALAFGDSCNDLDMLQAVGTGIAMGNANAQLKAIADEVCSSVSEDGIYRYCLDRGLI